MDLKAFYSLYLKANKVVIDNRKLEKGDLFFAFSGENFNAATLADKAIEEGALAVVVEDKQFENIQKNIIYVPSTLAFLQELAIYHRQQLKIPIIGLTGSNGKTTTKELISAVLATKFNVQFTKGNLNNHIGVPLTLLSIKPEHEIAVVEMGANHQKEIELLCSIAQPDYGYITNFGKAHLEGFGGFEGVIKGKSELYTYLTHHQKTILVNEIDPIQVEKTSNYEKKITFGGEHSQYQFEKYSLNNHVGVQYQNDLAISQLTGEYNFTNLCAAASFGFHFGIDFNSIKKAIEEYTPTNMRSQMMQKAEKLLVLDTYNANPSSMRASLLNFKDFNGTKTIIIGDMLELGEESRVEHEAILALAKELSFENIITVGKNFHEINSEKAFLDASEVIEYLAQHPIATQNILLKGSRGIALEKLIDSI